MTESTRKFDLNIERVLEHWTITYALREVIANALDEAALTSTADPSLFKDKHKYVRILHLDADHRFFKHFFCY